MEVILQEMLTVTGHLVTAMWLLCRGAFFPLGAVEEPRLTEEASYFSFLQKYKFLQPIQMLKYLNHSRSTCNQTPYT